MDSRLTMKWFNQTAEVSAGFCREAAVDYSPGLLRYATARPGVGTLTAYLQSRDVGLAESGLQPWVRQIEICALKVAPDVRRTGGLNTLFPKHIRRSPLSGRFNASPDPGLKPWAVLDTPFGRSERKKNRKHEH